MAQGPFILFKGLKRGNTATLRVQPAQRRIHSDCTDGHTSMEMMKVGSKSIFCKALIATTTSVPNITRPARPTTGFDKEAMAVARRGDRQGCYCCISRGSDPFGSGNWIDPRAAPLAWCVAHQRPRSWVDQKP